MKKINISVWMVMVICSICESSMGDSVEIDYSVRATMHTVEGTAETDKLDVDIKNDALSIEVNVPIESMVTGNKKRDLEMHHVLREDLQDTIKGQLISTSLEMLRPGDEKSDPVSIRFSMAQQEQDLEAIVTAWSEEEGDLDFTLEFDVSQKAYGLKPISKMGFLKVDDTVHVICRFHIEK